MVYDDDIPDVAIPSDKTKCWVPYNSSLAASASSSSTSVWSDAEAASITSWSDASSQTSDDSMASHSPCTETNDAFRQTNTTLTRLNRPTLPHNVYAGSLPAETRQHPRRTSIGARSACPPTLVRQCDRKLNFVDSLVDSSTQIVEAIWPLSSVVCRSELGNKAVLPLRTFIQETLRRSRTSYSTLQVALYYLILVKPHVPKHNFTMEQPDDQYADRSLQCGRRMFLSALILASKYLQDRNYSARAWSKISGLNTHEINQNEIAFLLAVNWKLHIADDVFQRWTEIVLKYTPPPSPPSPDGVPALLAQQRSDWKNIILKLNPELTNVEGLFPVKQAKPASPANPLFLRNILNTSYTSVEGIETPRSAPISMEPNHTPISFAGARLAPSLGALPTPRLTPQMGGFCTPAASAPSTSHKSGMLFAMAQVNAASASQYHERCPLSISSSPSSYFPARRSSLATSVSTASSPESMVSDTSSLASRSSSISSASSCIASATLNQKLSVQSRFRCSKLSTERLSQQPSVPSVPEDCDAHHISSSPDTYNGPVGRLGDLSLRTPLARRENDLEVSGDASFAARVLQDLHNHGYEDTRTGTKRSRTSALDDSLHENVRDILVGKLEQSERPWLATMLRSDDASSLQVPGLSSSNKRLCCSVEAANGYKSMRKADLWDSILN